MPPSKPPIRKKGPPRPPPVGWRPETDAQRAMWFEVGAGKWVRRLLNAEIAKQTKHTKGVKDE